MPSLTQLSGKNDSDNDQESSNATHGNLTNEFLDSTFKIDKTKMNLIY